MTHSEKRRWARKRERKLARKRKRANPTISEIVKEDPGDAMRAHAGPASASGTAASADAHPNASGVKKCKRERANPLICNM